MTLSLIHNWEPKVDQWSRRRGGWIRLQTQKKNFCLYKLTNCIMVRKWILYLKKKVIYIIKRIEGEIFILNLILEELFVIVRLPRKHKCGASLLVCPELHTSLRKCILYEPQSAFALRSVKLCGHKYDPHAQSGPKHLECGTLGPGNIKNTILGVLATAWTFTILIWWFATWH